MNKLLKQIALDLNPDLDSVEKFYENVSFIEPIEFLERLEKVAVLEWEPEPEEFLRELEMANK